MRTALPKIKCTAAHCMRKMLTSGALTAAVHSQVDFLYDLMRLDEAATSGSDFPSKPAHELPERRAARGLFRWEVRSLKMHAPIC